MNLSPAFIAIAMLQKPALLITPIGRYIDGIWEVDGSGIEIKAVIQAATQQDLVQYSDREKLDGFVRIWTSAPLQTTDEDLGLQAQSITCPEGRTYRIVKAGRRNEAGFTRAIGRLSNDRRRSVSAPENTAY